MSAPRPLPGEGSAATEPDLPDAAYLCALAGLTTMGPTRLRTLVAERGARGAWLVASGQAPRPGQLALELPGLDAVLPAWRREARHRDPAELLEAHHAAGVGLTTWGSASMPQRLAEDPDPPVVLFHTGSLRLLSGPSVAIVGTRRATRYGLDVAAELGRDLAAAGVRVVSGLAGGIDAAAHRGALAAGAAPPVAVVGSGLDVVYPRRNRQLWADVVAAGIVLSEYPLGTRPLAWHFPARNRLVAALADVLVVVESAERGGSLYTVDEAARRDVPVLAVPGSVRSPVSAGTNALLAAGCGPCRDAQDVLTLLGLRHAGPVRAPRREAPPELRAVLDALEWQPLGFDTLLARTGLDAGALGVALAQLEAGGWLEQRGGLYERAVTG